MLPRDHSCNILVENIVNFFFCPKSMTEAKESGFELIRLSKETSKQSSIVSVYCILVITVMGIYDEKEKHKQGKLHKLNPEEKKGTRM